MAKRSNPVMSYIPGKSVIHAVSMARSIPCRSGTAWLTTPPVMSRIIFRALW